jgi:uncharacterized repeat protein (TIGR03803 family)
MPDQSGTTWTGTALHSFCPNSNCADGATPSGELAIDGGGHVYGTTQYGGANNKGTAFQLTPGKGWNHNILYSFCSQANCADGAQPQAGMIIDKSGNLYGTTDNVVFQLSPQKSGWSYQLLYTFCSLSNCADGGDLVDNVILDRAGNLYGTTNVGGNRRCGNSTLYGCGVVFELTPPNQYFGWTETVLYSFCPQGSCTDGSGPQAGLTMDAAGNLYGTTYFGGNYTYCGYGCGVVFALTIGKYALTVSETGSGKVTSSPAGIDCPTSCSAILPGGTQVSLTATPAHDWTLTGWGGACSGTGTCTLTMNSSQSVAATFTHNFVYAVLVSVVGSAGGKVTSSPAGIDCGATCSSSFAAGTQVTLTASPAKGWGFAGWGGACSGIGSCTVKADASSSVSANFSTLFGSVADPVVTSPNDLPALPPALIGPLPND